MSQEPRENYERLIGAVFGEKELPGLGGLSFSNIKRVTDSVLSTLSARESGVISMRFGLQDGIYRTLDEIGEQYDLTIERIRQIESKTMSKLRHPDRSQILRDLF